MSQKNKNMEVIIDALDDDEEDEFEDGDYGFIISSDGELKSLMFPDDLMDDPPAQVRRILKIFGIKDIHNINCRTLH